MAEVAASSKNLRRLPECNILFQMMLSESLSHSYFSNGNTCVAVQLVAVSVDLRTISAGELLKRDKILWSI